MQSNPSPEALTPKWDVHNYARGIDDFAALLRYLRMTNATTYQEV